MPIKQYLITAMVTLLIGIAAWHRGKERERIREAEKAKAAYEMREPSNERPAELDNLPPRRRHKHHVVVNSTEPVYVYHFPTILKNVESIELVSAIVPRGQLRINEYNNVLPIIINGVEHVIHLKLGDYINILYFLIEVNYQLRQIVTDPNQYIVFIYDLMATRVFVVTSPTMSVSLPFGNYKDTVAQGLGFDPRSTLDITADIPSDDRNVGRVTASMNYLNDRMLSDTIINNYPVSIYTDANLFPMDPVTGQPSLLDPTGWKTLMAHNRANLSFQLYIDIDVDEISYWDGSNHLARIFISDDEEQVEYRAKASDVHRKMREEMKDFDRLTIRMNAVSGVEAHPYKLNGLPYSLQFEIITLDN